MRTRNTVALSVLAGCTVGGLAVQVLHAQTKPPAYAIVEIDVTDQQGYFKDYVPVAVKVVEDGGGKHLVRGGKTVGIVGEPPKSRIVLIGFDNLERAQATFNSPAYRDATKIGEKYAKFRIWAVEGTPQ
jgi:uncharacterized protein (DUF1330 family)